MKIFTKATDRFKCELVRTSKPTLTAILVTNLTIPIIATMYAYTTQNVALSVMCVALWIMGVPDVLRNLSNRYAVADHYLFVRTLIPPTALFRINLKDITSVTVHQNRLEKFLGVASIDINTSDGEIPTLIVTAGQEIADRLSALQLRHVSDWEEWVEFFKSKGIRT